MKKLLFSLMIAGFSAVTVSAQSKVWNFSDTSKFTPGTISSSTTIDGLTFEPVGSNLTIATNNLATFTDLFAPTQRLQFGGNSYAGSDNPAEGVTSMPTRRYVKFSVPGAGTIKLWARGGGANRSLLISDGAGKVLKSFPFASNANTDLPTFEYSYTGSAGTILISTGAGDNSLYKIEYIDGATMAANDIKSNIQAKVFSSGNRIFLSGLDSINTQVDVYSANGSLVKTLKTASDMSFDIAAKGIYIVNLKSVAGEKSVKVMMR